MGDSLDNQDTLMDAQSVTIVEFAAFANYIKKAATILLPEEDSVPPELIAAMDEKANKDCIQKFLSDPQVQALYIQRSCIKGRSIAKRVVGWVYCGRVAMTAFVLFFIGSGNDFISTLALCQRSAVCR